MKLEQAKSEYRAAVDAHVAAQVALGEAGVRLKKARETMDTAQLKANEAIPVDRTARTLTDGSPVTDDHREITEGGLQKGYVVLSDAERAKGFVRPVRDAYRHTKCNSVTTMGRSLAETYARDPSFYSGTFCSHCHGHFPVGAAGEFIWLENDGQEINRVGT